MPVWVLTRVNDRSKLSKSVTEEAKDRRLSESFNSTYRLNHPRLILNLQRIIAVHPFKKLHLERDRAHLEKLIIAALGPSGASASPEDEPRLTYYAVDPDDFSFDLKSSSTAGFVKEGQKLAKNVKSLLVSELMR